MRITSLFVDGAEIRLDDGRSIVTCLLDLCPDRDGANCWQSCPVLTAQEVRQIIAKRPETLIAQFLSREIADVGEQHSA